MRITPVLSPTKELESILQRQDFLEHLRNQLNWHRGRVHFLVDPFGTVAAGWLRLKPDIAQAWAKQAGYNCTQLVVQTDRQWWQFWIERSFHWLVVSQA